MWPLKSVFLWLSGQMAFDRVSLNVRSQKTKTSKGEKNTLQLHFLFACKPLRGDSWGSSQATSGHTCELLDSQLCAAALNVLIPTSSFPTSSFSCFPVYLFLVPTVISCSRFLWPILFLPLLFANSPWEAAPALGMPQMRWNEDSPCSVGPARLVEMQNHVFEKEIHYCSCWP